MALQKMIETDKQLQARGQKQVADQLREEALDRTIATLMDSYRCHFNKAKTPIGKQLACVEKLKLEAYLACKQKDKDKACKAIEAYRTAAVEFLDAVMEGGMEQDTRLKIFRGPNGEPSYFGEADKQSENARQLGTTFKNTYTMLQWFYDNLGRSS